MNRPGTATLFTALLTALLTTQAACFTTVESPEALDTAQTRSLERFDYDDWRAVTATHVDAAGRVAYAALKRDRRPLDRFVALLGAVGPKTRPDLFRSRAQQLAYYINAYNALTLFNVVNRYPEIRSVHDDKRGFFYFTEFKLDGDEVSLYNLENKIIRPRFSEPRVHFALNCASAGCPVLPGRPFMPQTLEQQLAAETRAFLHARRNVSKTEGKVTLSKIFEWYAEDFDPSPLAWIAAAAPELKLSPDAEVRYRPYDWSLNDWSLNDQEQQRVE